MSQFDWQTDEEFSEVWDADSAEITPSRRSRLPIYLLLVLVATSLLGIGGYAALTRANENVGLLEQQLINWQAAAASATANGDQELLQSLLGDTKWAETEAAARIDGTRFDRSAFGLIRTDDPPISDISFNNNFILPRLQQPTFIKVNTLEPCRMLSRLRFYFRSSLSASTSSGGQLCPLGLMTTKPSPSPPVG